MANNFVYSKTEGKLPAGVRPKKASVGDDSSSIPGEDQLNRLGKKIYRH